MIYTFDHGLWDVDVGFGNHYKKPVAVFVVDFYWAPVVCSASIHTTQLINVVSSSNGAESVFFYPNTSWVGTDTKLKVDFVVARAFDQGEVSLVHPCESGSRGSNCKVGAKDWQAGLHHLVDCWRLYSVEQLTAFYAALKLLVILILRNCSSLFLRMPINLNDLHCSLKVACHKK